jgi:hypothetical protein
MRFLPFLLLSTTAWATPPAASWQQLPVGNGLGFAVFDANAKEINTFLERPYKYLHPSADPKALGVLRRNLVYDTYLGVRAGGSGAWLRDLPLDSGGYVDQAGIVRAAGTLGGVTVETYVVAPFAFAHNAIFLIGHATNHNSTATAVDLFANPNFHMGDPGTDPEHPSAVAESIAFGTGSATETGPGGGTMLYLPLGGFDKADCSGTAYTRVQSAQDLADTPRSATGDDLTLSWQKSLGTLAPSGEGWWGLAIVFVPADDPDGAAAVLSSLQSFVGSKSAATLLSDAQAEWAAWRKPPPAGLSIDETAVWRQAEAILRMAQVREPWTEIPKHKAEGMVLAALPPGEWHIGWVRDAQYATVALARSGHLAEAQSALDFFLDAEADRYMQYARVPYRISVTRYFGDGQEESDWNTDGPNVEFDGWGTYLWAARTFVDNSADASWLTGQTRAGETRWAVLRDLIAEPILANVDGNNGLVGPDTSIWESHWNNRKHYAYTSLAAARGLCDASVLAHAAGDDDSAYRYDAASHAIATQVLAHLRDSSGSVAGSLEELAAGAYLDAAVLDGINWGITISDPAPATLSALEGLRLPTGGYKRNDDNASSYDSNEWIFVDMRAASAWAAVGNAGNRDALVSWVTSQARLNFDLLPELYNQFPADGAVGAYAGAVPMVGFGAGAYSLALLDRSGQNPEQRNCSMLPPLDGGTDMAGGGKPASGCAMTGVPSLPGAFILLAALLLLLRRRT